MVEAMPMPKSANEKYVGIRPTRMRTPYFSEPRKRMMNGVETNETSMGSIWPPNVQRLPLTTFVVIPAVEGAVGFGISLAAGEGS